MARLEDSAAIDVVVRCGRGEIFVALQSVDDLDLDEVTEHKTADCDRVMKGVATKLSRAGFLPTGDWKIDERASDDDWVAWACRFARGVPRS
jgi:hypothetical protein